MQAEYYKNSIAVFGDTITWKENLKELGGSFNKNLNGRPGWVFKKESEPVLMQFIANANAGVIQPLPVPPRQQPAPVAQMVPFGQVQQGMTPQAAMARLALNIQQPTAQPVPVVNPLVPTPVAVGTTTPTTVNYPNTFTAADGVTYQILMRTVPMPHVGQQVTLHEDGGDIELTVTSVISPDHIRLTRAPAPHAPNPDDALDNVDGVVFDGRWRLLIPEFLNTAHHYTLTFMPQK